MAQHRRKRPIAEINVVPYIDVMLVLLVIFMITAPLLAQGVRVDLPQAPAKPIEDSDREPIVVSVDDQGRYFLNAADDPHAPIAADTLVTQVAAMLEARPGTRVLVKGDQSVAYGRVVGAMTLLQRAGAPSIGLVTRSPDEE